MKAFAAIAVVLVGTIAFTQEVGHIDLVGREIRGWQHRPDDGVGGGCGGGCSGGCRQPELQLQFVSVRDQTINPREGTEIEVRIENIGKKEYLLPFVPDPADIEPDSTNYRYDRLVIDVTANPPEGNDFHSVVASGYLYARRRGDYLRLSPGQSVSIRLRPAAAQEGFLKFLRSKGEVETKLIATAQVEAAHYHDDGKKAADIHDCSSKHIEVQAAIQEGIFVRYSPRKDSN